MQTSKDNSERLFHSRLFRRALACTLCVAAVFIAAGYNITSSAETKAKREFVLGRQELVTARLTGQHVDLYRTGDNSYEASETLQNELRQLLLQGQLGYLLLLDKNGVLVAQVNTGLQEGTMASLAAVSSLQRDLPFYEISSLDGTDFVCVVLELPRTEGLRVAYGISELRLADVGASLGGLLSGAVWAGALCIAVLGLFFMVFFISPLRKMLAALRHGQAAPATRKDELGELGLLINELSDEKAALSNLPVLNADTVFGLAAQLWDELEHGIILISLDGTVRSSNKAARSILGQASLPPRTHLQPLLEELLNPEQLRDFRRRFDMLPLVDDDPLHMIREDSGGAHSYAIRLSRHSVLGEDCVLCILFDTSDEYRLRRIESVTAARLEKAIHERTEELVKVNEQLRQENAERRAIEQALVRAESRYREIVNNSIEGIFQRTSDGRLLSANSSMARIFGYGSVEELLEAYQKPGTRICYTSEMEFAITELLDIRGWVSNLEFQALMQDGSPVWVAMNARRVADSSGETLYYEAFIEDITSRKKTEEKLVHQAFHDPLTGLPNRALFLDRLRMALRRTKRHNEYLFAVLYLDLDRFKNINDSFGHSAGDKMLNHATEKLLQCVREADTVARFGGDEFAVLLADLEKPSQAVLIAKRISAALNESVIFNGQEIVMGASIGIVLSTLDYNSPEEILRDADTAMYRSKMQGRRGYTVFNERMREETIAALALESDLRGAVERGEIEAFYQPLLDINNGGVFGFEALMRWRREGEVVSPISFIPIAEETGLIYELGLEIIRIVSRQVVEWTVTLGHCDFVVHVNISSKQLMAAHFWRDVQEILIETGVNPRQLIFEITESVFLDYGSQVISIMNIVRDFGIRFCLDDFGTGFSSLSYLRMLPLESLKVDRSFIVDINTDNYSEAILRNLVSMGSDLGLKVITEGVDQAEQVEVLRMVGCRYAQGFFFAEPLPAPEAAAYLQLHGPLKE